MSGAPDWRPTGQRIPSLEPDAWDDRTRRVLAPTLSPVAKLQADAAPQPRPLHILTTIAHHSKLLEAFLGFASTLTLDGQLSRRDAEILSLRTAWNCRSEFEWGHHRVYALAAGLSQAEIEGLAGDPDAASRTELESALIRAADELHAEQRVSNDTWSVLAAHYTPAQLVELIFTVGQYTLLSMFTNAAGVELEPHLKGLP